LKTPFLKAQISIYAECGEEDITEWLNCNADDPYRKIKNEQEICEGEDGLRTKKSVIHDIYIS
jgi:hypothetical protein